MKIVVFGAGGIVGQYMQDCAPKGNQILFVRSKADQFNVGVDLNNAVETLKCLDTFNPDVIVNLAGQNRVDVVEQDPQAYENINTRVPHLLSYWADSHKAHMLQVSTQGVFSGDNPPYKPTDTPDPITMYGIQKAEAEKLVQSCGRWTIARLTFVIGMRLRDIGRINPLEDMISSREQLQVKDRWFSPVFAEDAAVQLWKLALREPEEKIFHIGVPIRINRYELATKITSYIGALQTTIFPVGHRHFPGIAPRPEDTTWADGSMYDVSLYDGLSRELRRWQNGYPKKS